MTEYWHPPIESRAGFLATIPISQELIAKLRGEHWERWPSPEAQLRIRPLLDALEWRKMNGRCLPWQPLTDDDLRAYYPPKTGDTGLAQEK